MVFAVHGQLGGVGDLSEQYIVRAVLHLTYCLGFLVYDTVLVDSVFMNIV